MTKQASPEQTAMEAEDARKALAALPADASLADKVRAMEAAIERRRNPISFLLGCLSAVLVLNAGCSPIGEDPEGPDADLIGAISSNPNPLTFWSYGTHELSLPVLECALGRIRAATCLPLDVSFDAHHWYRIVAPEQMPPGLAGHTGGTWASTRVKVSNRIPTLERMCDILVHEIAQHVLRQKNSHVGPTWPVVLTDPLLSEICDAHECGCFSPEG